MKEERVEEKRKASRIDRERKTRERLEGRRKEAVRNKREKGWRN